VGVLQPHQLAQRLDGWLQALLDKVSGTAV
jgi:hypothetical protein